MELTDKVKWINSNGKKVLYVDYSNLWGKDLLAVFHQGKDAVIESKSNVLIMANFEKTKLNNDFLSAAKSSGQELNSKYEKSGLIGLSGVQKIMYQGYVRFTGQGDKMKLFNTKEECLEWLSLD